MSLLRYLILVIGLFGLIESVAFAESDNDSALCQPMVITSSSCEPSSPLVLAAINSCELQWKTNNCDNFASENPELVVQDKLKNCASPSACAQPPSVKDYIGSCANGISGFWSDVGAGALMFLFNKVNAPSENDLKKMEYFQKCESSLDKSKCKREMLGPFVNEFKPYEIDGHADKISANDIVAKNYNEGYSSAVLYRKLLLKLKKDSEGKNMNDKFIEPWSKEEADLPKSMDELIDQVLKKAGVKSPACYDSKILAEMRCYALAVLLAPTLVSQASDKISRLAGTAAKVVSKDLKPTAFVIKDLRMGLVDAKNLDLVNGKFLKVDKSLELKEFEKTMNLSGKVPIPRHAHFDIEGVQNGVKLEMKFRTQNISDLPKKERAYFRDLKKKAQLSGGRQREMGSYIIRYNDGKSVGADFTSNLKSEILGKDGTAALNGVVNGTKGSRKIQHLIDIHTHPNSPNTFIGPSATDYQTWQEVVKEVKTFYPDSKSDFYIIPHCNHCDDLIIYVDEADVLAFKATPVEKQ